MYSRYRRRIEDTPQYRKKTSLIPRLSKNQIPAFIILVLSLVALPITKFILQQNTDNRSRAFSLQIPDQARKGMEMAGLEKDTSGPCKNAYRVANTPAALVVCTHGPDPAPLGVDLNESVPPIDVLGATTKKVLGASVVCDGDGQSGDRIQVLYVHASDVADRFATYSASIAQWASDADGIFEASANETGGDRHLRFVHDTNCAPIITDVQVSPTGDDDFGNTMSELAAQGYSRTDRKYMIFMDAHVYCGIGTINGDDSIGANNINNNGGSYARVDSGCWSGATMAHETMHNLGGVQLSAPHSSGGWHCIDEYDRMCYSDTPNYPAMQTLCANTTEETRFDCNHDDYFSTNPVIGSYLASHWNTANSAFLIGAVNTTPVTPTPTSKATPTPTKAPTPTPTRGPTSTPTPTPSPQSMTTAFVLTGILKGKTITQATTFSSGSKVSIQVHVINQSGGVVSGATVNLAVKKPDGSTQCELSGTTSSIGDFTTSCSLPRNAPAGTWDVHINSLTKANYFVGSPTATDTTFVVQ